MRDSNEKIISWIGAVLWLLFLCLSAYNFITFTLIRVDRQGHARFCRAEIPSYCVKALENTQSILSL